MDAALGADDDERSRPPIVGPGSAAVVQALGGGAIVAVPNVGGYCLAVRAGLPAEEARLAHLAADPDGPHYAVGQIEDVRALTSGWTDELGTLLQRCWPGPVEVFVPWAGAETSADAAGAGSDDDVAGTRGPSRDPYDEADSSDLRDSPDVRDSSDTPDSLNRPDAQDLAATAAEFGAWAVIVGMPDGRALRRLCREQGPWRTVPLRFTEAEEVVQAFRAEDVAVVVDGGRREGPLPTVVDATVTPIRVLREGALPASFIEGTMLMSTRRKFFSRKKRAPAG